MTAGNDVGRLLYEAKYTIKRENVDNEHFACVCVSVRVDAGRMTE